MKLKKLTNNEINHIIYEPFRNKKNIKTMSHSEIDSEIRNIIKFLQNFDNKQKIHKTKNENNKNSRFIRSRSLVKKNRSSRTKKYRSYRHKSNYFFDQNKNGITIQHHKETQINTTVKGALDNVLRKLQKM
jgi:hypothetical protein